VQFKETLTAMLQAVPSPVSSYELTPLAGDASSRRYFRVRGIPDSGCTFILMSYNAEAASEEGGSGRVPSELPFVNLQRFLSGWGWPVPALYQFSPEAGLLLMEDFGDVTLEAWLAGRTEDEIFRIYARAIDLLVQLQIEGTSCLTPDCWASGERFTEGLFRWELEHFYEYGVVARYGAAEPGDEAIIHACFDEIARRLATLPQVLVHRDYHSRNLMVDGSRLGVIDFQDALLGPRHYDLASLLKDSYVSLSERLIDPLIEHYLEAWAAAGGQTRDDDPAIFRETFDLVSIQRNLKAAGRFDYIDLVKKNPKFLASIPHTLENVRCNLARHPWLAPLQEALGRKMPALRAS